MFDPRTRHQFLNATAIGLGAGVLGSLGAQAVGGGPGTQGSMRPDAPAKRLTFLFMAGSADRVEMAPKMIYPERTTGRANKREMYHTDRQYFIQPEETERRERKEPNADADRSRPHWSASGSTAAAAAAAASSTTRPGNQTIS